MEVIAMIFTFVIGTADTILLVEDPALPCAYRLDGC